MKTKVQRDITSKKRQKVGEEMVVWEQNIKDLVAHPECPEHVSKLAFAQFELRRCRAVMQRLNIGEKRQRFWASGRVFGHARAQ
jgi:hypothetical protein